MDNKETENLISGMLNSQKPDKSVLSAAKCVMEKNKLIRLKYKRRSFVLAGCAAVCMVIGVIFAMLSRIYNNNNWSMSAESIIPSSYSLNRGYLIAAVILISIGIVLTIAAVIISFMKNKIE